ncbi:receptor like protein kinase S.2-like isoform X3 [Miscanthus floridulus]|uniref:receptor like protein kinase S.2-like isoform X3 n=1 Tax=Miscanthus floridulus TaxID=154761 RepID=UPI00345AF77F
MSDQQASEVEDLERIFADASKDPIQISYGVIKSITKNFAQVIGNGAFGVVYLGALKNGMVAVKKLSQSTNDLSDTQFLAEVKCLKRVKHQNIVRFLGYCVESHGEVIEIDGKHVIAEVQQRLLCFEYVPNGSLHDYLQDFGVSRCIDENQSTICTVNLYGTPGYIAPELIDKNTISFKSDIFSFGIIMARLLTGSNGSITENWHETLNTDCQQMKRCIEVAKNCVESEPYKRPTIADIVHKLNEIETTIQKVPQVVNEPRNDPSSSLHQVVKRFKALSVQTLHEYSRFADIYEDLNVLEHIVEGSENPSNLSYPLLQFITENFSDKRKIGHNELGECFKGIVQIVVVTRLSGSLNINDGVFHQQIGNIMMARHQNVVQFLGYCSYAVEKKVEIGGDVVIAEKRERLLCFEYLSKGNLSNHLSDELSGLEWHTRYQIIKGICEGLCYLHKEKDIIHMDLKPASILLDDDMVPKIADFGISKLICTSDERLRQLGYSAPERMSDGVTSRKADIYSLGVIITELVTGSKTKPSITNIKWQVLCRWEQRWNKSGERMPSVHQVTKCLELAQSCLHKAPNRRPFVWDIIRELNKLDKEDLYI